MSKYERVCEEISQTEKKLNSIKAKLKKLYESKTEFENVEIINAVREIVVDSNDLMAFLEKLKSGKTNASKEVDADE